MSLLLAMAAVACSPDETGLGSRGNCVSALLPGDIVFSEIMPNPPGADEGHEWLELFNASSSAMDLSGAVLVSARPDGSDGSGHFIDGLALEPGQYVVLGDLLNEPDVLTELVDYGYGNDLGSMGNEVGRLQLSCGATVIDDVLYENATDSAARGFDGAVRPDAIANDDLAAWCDAKSPLGDGFGTPAAVNDPCGGAIVSGSCMAGGTERSVTFPAVGDVVITEVMPDPSATADEAGEWFELYAIRGFDLNGLQLGRVTDELESMDVVAAQECLAVEAGSYLVFAANADMTMNGGLPHVDHTLAFSLSNSSQTTTGVFVGIGDEVLDQVEWNASRPGKSWSLDPDWMDPASNDQVTNYFCEGTTTYGSGDLGTPGTPNPQCVIAPPAGQCVGDDGNLREVVPPGPGDVVITEFMSNPAAVDDGAGEWFELSILGNFDLNGLEFANNADGVIDDTIEVERCLSVSAGDSVVLANNADPATNGGLANVVYQVGFSLTNNNAALRVSYGGQLLDAITWTTSVSGAATSLPLEFATTTGNDDELNWCAASTAYGAGDLGTPGAANPVCGAVAVAGTCLDAGVARETVLPQPGDLVITELLPQAGAVTDGAGEWFEVFVNRDVDLNGLSAGWGARPPAPSTAQLPDPVAANFTLVVDDCERATAGSYLLFARNALTADNGGLPEVDVVISNLQMANSDGRYVFLAVGPTMIDVVTYSGSTDGVAQSLGRDSLDAAANDDEGLWCPAIAPYGAGDLGTPRAENPVCGGAGQCLEDGTPRDAIVPQVGDLVITEFMPNPDGDDGEREWFEILVNRNVDLNGLQIGAAAAVDPLVLTVEETIVDTVCRPVAAGSLLILAPNPGPMPDNGGLPRVDVVAGFGIGNNGLQYLFIGHDDIVLDAVTFNGSVAGASWNLDPDAQDTVTNDEVAVNGATNWCPGAGRYGDGGLGTPGESNLQCGG